MLIDLQGRVVWVTGASGALGQCIMTRLAEAGAVAVGSSRRTEGLADKDNLHWIAMDVTDAAKVEAARDEILRRLGRIDGLVTTATLPIFGDFLELTDDNWSRVIDTKFLGTIRAIRAVVPAMTKRGSGSIVVISGRGGINPLPAHLPGSTVNAALNILVLGLAQQLGPCGIRINAVSPGPVRSPRLEAMRDLVGQGATKSPLGGPGEPDDIADATLYLLSDKARFIAGANLLVDGGPRLQGAGKS